MEVTKEQLNKLTTPSTTKAKQKHKTTWTKKNLKTFPWFLDFPAELYTQKKWKIGNQGTSMKTA